MPLAFLWSHAQLRRSQSSETELGHDFTGNSRSAVDALLMKCKYNRNHLKIPNSCLGGLRRCVDTVCRRSTHHLRVRHRTEAGHKYIRLDFRHFLCWERRDEKYRKAPKEVKNAETAWICRCLCSTNKEKSKNQTSHRCFASKSFCRHMSSCFID